MLVIDYLGGLAEWFRYTGLFVVAFALAAIVCHFGKLMPWYFLFGKRRLSNSKSCFREWSLVAVAIAFFFLLPTGIVQAVTNQSIGRSKHSSSIEWVILLSGLNVITEFVAGVAIPGDPLANVTFKTYGYITQYQALLLISDLKLGHYMKVIVSIDLFPFTPFLWQIPPRAMFFTQLTGTIIAGVINYLTAIYLLGSIKDICTQQNPEWTCPNANTFFSASIIWGAIGE